MLSIKQLTHTYANGVKALQNINLDINNGMFGLLGPNGAGKSSLMRTLATLQLPTSGRLYLNDYDIVKQPEQIRRVLGYLPQDFGLYPRATAEKLLDHIAALKGVLDYRQRKKVVDGLLHQTNLYQHRRKKLSTFSGGMKQRFGIAQALIGQPKLIIVDEPTAGLDPEERNRFHNLLAAIGEETIVILSTHIVSDVSNLCSDMAIMTGGHIVANDKPQGMIEPIKGKIWSKRIDKKSFDEYNKRYKIISSHLSAGQMIIRVFSLQKLQDGFIQATADLEDVYFLMVNKKYKDQPDESKIKGDLS